MKPHLLAVSNACLKAGRIPSAMAGCICRPIYKKGATSDTANYRGISLQYGVAKILAKMLLRRVERVATFPSWHITTSCSRDVAFGHLVLTQHAARVIANKTPAAWISLDVLKAYDRVVRQILLADPEAAVHQLCAMGFHLRQVREVVAHIRQSGPALEGLGIDDELLRLMASTLDQVWMQLPPALGSRKIAA
eukprot:6043876-Amphidinium_carterae.2